MSANKLDSGKLQYHLIPPLPLRELARVFSYGAALPAYGPWNWHKGLKYSRLYDATQRHMEAFRSGERYSEHEFSGSNCHHLAHAIFGLMCLLQFDLEGREELDDLRLPERTYCPSSIDSAQYSSDKTQAHACEKYSIPDHVKPIPKIPDYDQETVAAKWRETFSTMISDSETIERMVERMR